MRQATANDERRRVCGCPQVQLSTRGNAERTEESLRVVRIAHNSHPVRSPILRSDVTGGGSARPHVGWSDPPRVLTPSAACLVSGYGAAGSASASERRF